MGHILPHAFRDIVAAADEKSPMGHRLPYAFTAQGSLLSSLEYAVSRVLSQSSKVVQHRDKIGGYEQTTKLHPQRGTAC